MQEQLPAVRKKDFGADSLCAGIATFSGTASSAPSTDITGLCRRMLCSMWASPAMSRCACAACREIRCPCWKNITTPKRMQSSSAKRQGCFHPVSYTHLDVYKRQGPGFKGDAPGSDKNTGFSLPHDPQSDLVLVFEAPIDLMSYLTLHRDRTNTVALLSLIHISSSSIG